MLQTLSFASYKDNFFLNKDEGLLVLPKATPEFHAHIKAEKEFMCARERKGTDQASGKCIGCEAPRREAGMALFPESEEPRLFVCEECVKTAIEKATHEKQCPCGVWEGFKSLMDEHSKKASRKKEEATDAILRQAETQNVFSLEASLGNRFVFLNAQTTVLLENTEIHIGLFFDLLSKTRVSVGRGFSVSGNSMDIKQGGVFSLGPPGKGGRLFVENVKKIPPKSIVYTDRSIFFDGHAVGLFPKLRINGNREMGVLSLCAEEKEQVLEITEEEDNSIDAGRVSIIVLKHYAVNALPKLRQKEHNVVQVLSLEAGKKDHVAAMVGETNSICIGRTSELFLGGYAAGVLPRLAVSEDNLMRVFEVDADREEQLAAVLGEENSTVDMGALGAIALKNHAVSILAKLKLREDCTIKKLSLSADKEEQIAAVLRTEKNSIAVGGVREVKLVGYAIGVLPKLKIREDNVMEKLLAVVEEEHQKEAILGTEDCSIDVGVVLNMTLVSYAAAILPKLRTREDRTMEWFCIHALKKEDILKTFGAENKAVNVGRIKRKGFFVSAEVEPMLKYVLVDEERAGGLDGEWDAIDAS
ncbi:MAG: uncharacterized protein A8A55_1910 [Amphiamblys sp. WSBS2006]|nr:MAG: uncharacterized protein A8A55_1910 [Amphiamblys sp. WSBS2006]